MFEQMLLPTGGTHVGRNTAIAFAGQLGAVALLTIAMIYFDVLPMPFPQPVIPLYPLSASASTPARGRNPRADSNRRENLRAEDVHSANPGAGDYPSTRCHYRRRRAFFAGGAWCGRRRRVSRRRSRRSAGRVV